MRETASQMKLHVLSHLPELLRQFASYNSIFDGPRPGAELRVLPRSLHRRLGGAWGKSSDFPEPPAQSFAAWYRKNRGN